MYGTFSTAQAKENDPMLRRFGPVQPQTGPDEPPQTDHQNVGLERLQLASGGDLHVSINLDTPGGGGTALFEVPPS